MIPETKLNSQYGLFIDGAWRPSADGKTFDSFCPATGDKLASCAEAMSQDVDAAVDAAWKAFATWKKTMVKERATLLNKIADIIDAHTDELALIETLDNGKPIRETKNIDVPLSAAHFRYFAGCILAEEGSATMLDNTTMSIILREPIGVVGQIVPWNFPFLMAAWKLAPVLASGCCTVLKPSKTTSLSVLYFADLIKDILPPGVFNVITGAGSKAGQYMLDHKGFCKLAFTGSTEVGLSVGSRIFVQEDIYDEFVSELVNRFNKVKIGLPWKEDTQLGATIYKAQLDKVLSYVELAKKEGATIACGGERATDGALKNGIFMKPTLITDATNDMRVAREEIFGPVAVVIKFKTEEEVIKMANDSDYGLGGAVWTQDINRAFRVANAIETGRVWVNTYNQIPEGSPFGGYKQSGIGRETHKVILEHYTQMKNILVNLSGQPSGFYSQK